MGWISKYKPQRRYRIINNWSHSFFLDFDALFIAAKRAVPSSVKRLTDLARLHMCNARLKCMSCTLSYKPTYTWRYCTVDSYISSHFSWNSSFENSAAPNVQISILFQSPKSILGWKIISVLSESRTTFSRHINYAVNSRESTVEHLEVVNDI